MWTVDRAASAQSRQLARPGGEIPTRTGPSRIQHFPLRPVLRRRGTFLASLRLHHFARLLVASLVRVHVMSPRIGVIAAYQRFGDLTSERSRRRREGNGKEGAMTPGHAGVDVSSRGEETWIHLEGELDHDGCEQVAPVLFQAERAGPVVVDMRGVTFASAKTSA